MRLPPSIVAWRIAACSRCGECAEGGSTRSSAASIRTRQAAKGAANTGSGIGRSERLGAGRFLRIAEQAHAQFRLLQRGLAFAVEADAAFVCRQRFLKAQVAALHLLD